MSDFPAVSDYEIPDTHDARVDRTLAGDLIREHKANLAFDIPTPVRWQPQAPKPTLGAAIQRALRRD